MVLLIHIVYITCLFHLLKIVVGKKLLFKTNFEVSVLAKKKAFRTRDFSHACYFQAFYKLFNYIAKDISQLEILSL